MISRKRIGIAVVESAGHLLVGLRPEGGPLAGLSEFPGGKCESDETPRSCAVRECREETGLLVIPREHLATVEHSYAHGIVELHFWRCVLSPELDDLIAPVPPFQWVTFAELRALEFPEANRSVVERLLTTDA
ncbi:MAG: (deoxy)nucleoside triphosphate pyrophosphohydrolase [Planctomycetota bacterium]